MIDIGEVGNLSGMPMRGEVSKVSDCLPRINAWFGNSAGAITSLLLLLLVTLPVLEIIFRPLLGLGIPGSINYVRHLTLWIGFLGAVVTAQHNRHISLGAAAFVGGNTKQVIDVIARAVAMVTCLVLMVAAWNMVIAERESSASIGGLVPVWVAQTVMPLSLMLLAFSYFTQLIPTSIGKSALVLLLAVFAVLPMVAIGSELLYPGLVIIAIAALAGAPIYVVLASLAALFFFVDGTPLASISVEAYRIAANPILPTIPLFTLAGTVMTAGNASARLVRLFQALFGWMPGGTAIAAICVCAFFTTFTGGSGVTILAIGGLMFPVLLQQGYQKRFSLGVLTASGSLGILLPPSLLIILYGVASHTPINQLFIAGLLPGVILVLLVCAYAIVKARQRVVKGSAFSVGEALAALRASKWDVLLPVAMLYGIFSGRATLVEVAALAAGYVLFFEFVVFRDLKWSRDLGRVLRECSIMVGGIMIILACAMGLTNFVVYADIPLMAAAWIETVTQSPWVFLLALNGFLLVAGCLLDIFSAIVVVVPLILPVATAFGIDPVHLGILFLVNMELGYLTPPVGMNLYLASFRFGEPLMKVFRASLPFFLINLVVVLLVTFVPEITVGFAQWVISKTGQ